MKPIDAKFIGAAVGTPPALEWIAPDQLNIEPAYQRMMESSKSRRIVFGMVKRWDWSLCQPLIVTRRADGSLYVIDGQHRLEGARQRGDIAHLPCTVLSARSVEDEAEAFVKLNTQRQRLTQVEIFAGMLAQGDPDARRIAELVEATGWSLARHANSNEFRPGQLACAPMLARQIALHGEAPVRNALVALREAFPDTPVRQGSSLLRALIDLYREYELPDPDAFIEALGAVDDPSDWLVEAQMVQRENPAFSRREALVYAFREAARDAAGQDRGLAA